MWVMDVWVHGGALIALWVVAAALVLLVILVAVLLSHVAAIRGAVNPAQVRRSAVPAPVAQNFPGPESQP